jgi:hypothetical protein
MVEPEFRENTLKYLNAKGFNASKPYGVPPFNRGGKAVDGIPWIWNAFFIHNMPRACPRILHRFVR